MARGRIRQKGATLRPGVVLLDDGTHVEALEEGGGLMSREVVRLTYRHVEDPAEVVRFHDFQPGTYMLALPGTGAVLIARDRGAVWEDF